MDLKLYRPEGYPELGLTAKTISLRYRKDANLAKLAKKVERWEAKHGNDGFEARNLVKLPKELAFELCNVYIALRERYPEVKPDYIDFAVKNTPGQTLGLSTVYPATFPTLREAAETYDVVDLDSLLESIREDEEFVWNRKDLRREKAWGGEVRNVSRSGTIELGDMFRVKKHYMALLSFWERRNARASLLGRPLRTPELATSAATFVFVHEFGHLVEGEMFGSGDWRNGADVYGELSQIILGGKKPKVHQWRRHLINYPCFVAPEITYGPVEGGSLRQSSTKRALRTPIAEKLGTYAPVARDEIFAEAFALSHCAEKKRRRELSGMLRALERCGLRRRNVQPRRDA
jgi:hypothetical protein